VKRHCAWEQCTNPAESRVEVDARGGGAYFQYSCYLHVNDLAHQLEAMPDGRGIAWLHQDGEVIMVFDR
jgi:hypothetical protein